MELKIVRYKNYGGVISTEGESTIMYWSFFEISNGKVIATNYIDYKNTNCNDLEFHYTECYNFGEEFFAWWDKTMVDGDKDLGYPSKDEEELIELFWYKNIEVNRNVKTEIICI